MKRTAQELGGIEQVRFKQQEIHKLLDTTLPKLYALVNPNISPNQLVAQMKAILEPISKEIKKKVLELSSIKEKQPATTPAAADDYHLGPRGKKQNKNLPDFWRRNFDYLHSPYMHLDKIKKITDRPKMSKRK